MSQKEQFEFTCIRCSHTSILESEPTDDYVCQICKFVPPSKEHDSRFSKNYVIPIPPKYWRCGNHHQTFKWGNSCPECLKKFTQRNFPPVVKLGLLVQVLLYNLGSGLFLIPVLVIPSF